MTRIAKLCAAIAENPRTAITFAEFDRLLAAAGFTLVRIRGSHRHYAHPAVPFILTVLPDGKGVKPYLVRHFLEIVDEHGLHIG